MKHCPDCQRPQGEVRFYRNRASYDGLCTVCTECDAKRRHDRYVRNRAHEIARGRVWAIANRAKTRKYQRKWRVSPHGRESRRRNQRVRVESLHPTYIKQIVAATGATPEAVKRSILVKRARRSMLMMFAGSILSR